ncbi:hypothetical protein RYX36_011966 [Vicia faba]
MALQTQFTTYFTTKTHHSFSPNLTVRSEKPSEPSNSVPRKSGVGFGPYNVNTKRKQKGQRERGSIIHRNPVEKTALVKEQEPVQQEYGAYENAFSLAWLGFGFMPHIRLLWFVTLIRLHHISVQLLRRGSSNPASRFVDDDAMRWHVNAIAVQVKDDVFAVVDVKMIIDEGGARY